MSIEEEGRKRSSRVRTTSARVRVFDAATRAEIQRKKLAALEADNWVEDRPKDDDNDSDYHHASSGDEMAVDAPKRKNRKKKAKNDKFSAAQKCKTLQEIIDDAQYDHYPSWVPNFASVAAAPSIYPKRNFCPITGLLGKYKCPMTGEYLATLPAYETHRETRLKGLI